LIPVVNDLESYQLGNSIEDVTDRRFNMESVAANTQLDFIPAQPRILAES